MLERAANAFRLQVASVSPSRKATISSDASEIREGECEYIEETA
jgi:hypothetical protein